MIVSLEAADPADNLTETAADEAEFRQGGIGQQLMSGYPVMNGLYGSNAAGYGQHMAAASAGGGSYVNMLRNLYRPPSMGLTDKVKHWVKSFMNRRQYVKPYYSPSMSNLQYSADEFGAKPMYVGANGYKAISVPLRQLQKYYKPYYASGDATGSQLLQSPPRSVSGNAAAASMMSYSPGSVSLGQNGGLYASEAANAAHFTSGSSGLFSSGSDSNGASLFGNGASSGSNLFSAGSGHSSNIFSGSHSGGLYGSSSGASGNIFSSSDGASSALFSAASLPGGSIYGSSGSPSSGLYHTSNGGAGSSMYSMDSGNSGIYSSDGGSSGSNGGTSSFYSSGNDGSSYGSSGAASGLHASLNSGSSGGSYGGDLYASGASPSATIYNPNSGDQARGYGGNKKSSYGGAGSSALYMPSDQRNAESYPGKSQESVVNSFNVDSSSNRHQGEQSYSVSFQPAQGKSYDSNSGFQPVSFSSEEGYKGGSFQGKSS